MRRREIAACEVALGALHCQRRCVECIRDDGHLAGLVLQRGAKVVDRQSEQRHGQSSSVKAQEPITASRVAPIAGVVISPSVSVPRPT